MAFRCPTPVPPPAHPIYDIDQAIRAALEEDSAGVGDVTTLATIGRETWAEARFFFKSPAVVAGICIADRVFELVDPSLKVTWYCQDGASVQKGDVVGHAEGSARSILLAERVCLNFMQRMSGIASLTARMVQKIQDIGSATKLLDTRKTVPGLRLLDKWAVLIGGGVNHRMGLFDMMMIKDNHIAAAGGLEAAIQKGHEYLEAEKLTPVKIEVETSTLEEVREAKRIIQSYGRDGRVTRVMLDNMTSWEGATFNIDKLQEAMTILKELDVEVEASGNVTIETVQRIASTGVTFISCGALTHSVPAVDISLKIQTKP